MIDQIIEKINESQKIAIFCHENPDGDAVGSLLGLGTLLENQGKNVCFFAPTKPSKIFGFLPGIEKIKTDFDYGEYDLIIFVDCSENIRLGIISRGNEEYFLNHDIVVFDHHELKNNKNNNRLIIDDPNATSCCEVIFESLKDIRSQYFTPQIATYFYLGLTTDSGNFKFDEDHERIFTNALSLIKLGADKDLIINNLINCKSLETILFLKTILDRFTIDGDIVYSYYDTDEFDEYGVDNEQAGLGLTIIQEIKGPKIAMTIRKSGDVVKCSLRSKFVDVSKIALLYGGGGHIHAAGFTTSIVGDFDSTIKMIVEKIKTLI